jgi:hypothetical protein
MHMEASTQPSLTLLLRDVAAQHNRRKIQRRILPLMSHSLALRFQDPGLHPARRLQHFQGPAGGASSATRDGVLAWKMSTSLAGFGRKISLKTAQRSRYWRK